MLDVHAPHERITGVKDFLLHLFTITVGLLIALGLEGCVERAHKHELRQEAERNLRQEIQDNTKQIENSKPDMAAEQKMLIGVLDFLQARKIGKTTDTSQLQLGFSMHPLARASWQTATATGALGLMEYDQVQRYAAAYQIQEAVDRLQQQALEDFLRLQSYAIYGFDPAKVSAADASSAEPDVRHALAHLIAMRDLELGALKGYDKALQGK